ncbi:hypothetical protein [Salinicoccus sp. HZC-1]|uniref:hypothetical protein n=1 Tax=Salinicoccus sp. HZC-1 TaxID=3385497 RepID=UPI00398A71E8
MENITQFLGNHGALIGVIIGGLCTIAGSYLSANKQVNNQKDIFNSQKEETTNTMRWQLKYSILADIVGNRRCIVGGNPQQNTNSSDSVVFFVVLNKVGTAFYDSEEVTKAYDNFHSTILTRSGDANEDLYLLVFQFIKI